MIKNRNWWPLCLFLAVILLLPSCLNENKKRSVEINTPSEVKKMEQHTADIANTSFTDGMTGKVFHNYLQLSYSLYHEDPKGACKAAGNLAESFSPKRATLKNLAKQINSTEDLEKQRKLFFDFTREAEELIKSGLSGGSIYKLSCPLVYETGAWWFSDALEIRNPYLGSGRETCGELEQIIEKT